MKNILQQIFKYFSSVPAARNILFCVLGSILIWVIGPHLHFGGSTPFAGDGVRIFLIVIFFIGYFGKMLLKKMMQEKSNFLPLVGQKSKTCFQRLKIFSLGVHQDAKRNFYIFRDKVSQDKYSRQLRRMPWYLILGTPQSGKKSLLTSSGLRFLSPDVFGKTAPACQQQFPEYKWYWTEKAVLIDATKVQSNLEEAEFLHRRFLKFLKKLRHRKPLSGLILTFPLTDLLLMDRQERAQFIHDTAEQIRNMAHFLSTRIPVYVMLTKCDSVNGFAEFFNDLSKEELSQVWGMTFPLNADSDLNDVRLFFNRQYNQLILKLQQRVMWLMDSEKNMPSREAIYLFPQQMQLFKTPIQNFVSDLFNTLHQPLMQLRGIYFTSASQEGQARDLLRMAMSRQYEFDVAPIAKQEHLRESYFIQSLFNEVIFPEGKILGYSQRAQKIKKWSYRLSYVAIPLVVLFGFLSLNAAYSASRHNVERVKANLADYQLAYQNLSTSDTSLVNALSVLNALNNTHQVFQSSVNPWAVHFIYASHALSSETNDALERSVNNIFMPRVAVYLEAMLNKTNDNDNILYAILKGYLAFSPSGNTPPSAIKAPMEYTWSQSLQKDSQQLQQLRYYLSIGTEDSIEPLPLDKPLINRIRLELKQIVPAERAYGLLTFRAGASDIPPIVFDSMIGSVFSQVFAEKNGQTTIPALYTADGFNQIFSDQLSSISRQVAEDNKAIGLQSDTNVDQTNTLIQRQVEMKYNKIYQQEWNDALNNLTLVPFSTLPQAINVMTLLTDTDSPLNKLMDIVYNNTHGVSSDNVDVASQFSALNNYSLAGGSQLQAINKTLTQIRDYLIELSQSANPDEASFKAAESYLTGNLKSPIQDLDAEIKTAPEPIHGWLQTIADNTWEVILQGALNKINGAWQTQILPAYQEQLDQRYPLFNKGGQISVDDFAHFFGPQGVLQKFFNAYLKPFINTNKTTWELYVLNNHGLAITPQAMSIFEKMNTMQNRYFADGTNVPHLNFAMKPVDLDNRAQSVQLYVGDQMISYSHGPQQLTQLNWPIQNTEPETKIVITDFSGRSFVKTFDGPWSFFQFLDSTYMKPTAQPDHYLVTAHVGGHSAVFEIVSTSEFGAFKLDAIKGMQLPTEL